MIGIGWAFAVGFGVGSVRSPASVAQNIMWGAGSAALTRPWVVRTIVRPVGSTLIRTAAADIGIMGRAFVGTTSAQIGLAAATGYVIGASGTTMVSAHLEKKGKVREGTTQSLKEFYTFGYAPDASQTSPRDRSKWYESDKPILNMHGDAIFIAKHYWNKAWS